MPNKDFLNPEQVLKKLKLNRDIVGVDFGCGSGGWVIPLAKILTDGKVYAIDILEEPLSVLRIKVNSENLTNIEMIRADVERKNGSRLEDGSVDLVLMTNLLFECEDKKVVLREGERILRPGGRVLVVDWVPETPMGPEKKVAASEVKGVAGEVGLKLEKEFPAGLYHYGLVFTKKV